MRIIETVLASSTNVSWAWTVSFKEASEGFFEEEEEEAEALLTKGGFLWVLLSFFCKVAGGLESLSLPLSLPLSLTLSLAEDLP